MESLVLLSHPDFSCAAGIYVLASEPVRIPWFDSIFADIGNEQSLAQSLSTFSGRLKQISVRCMTSINELLHMVSSSIFNLHFL